MSLDLGSFLKDALTADTSGLASAFGGLPDELGGFAWPWEIARKGAGYLQDHLGAAEALASGGHAVASSSAGPGILAKVASAPTDPNATGQVLGDGIFTPALDGVKADQLLRTLFIGWAGGAQVGIFGGGGGGGVAYDVVAQGDRAAVRYGTFKVGVGAQVGTGLLVGAMTREPGALDGGTAVFEFGAAIVGVGALVQVIMARSDLSLIGFVLNVGAGAGLSTTTGYGSIGVV